LTKNYPTHELHGRETSLTDDCVSLCQLLNQQRQIFKKLGMNIVPMEDAAKL